MSGNLETDPGWVRIIVEVATWLTSSLAGLVIGAWRWGRRSAKQDQKIKLGHDQQIEALRIEVRTNMAQLEKTGDARLELLVGQFKESFEGIRRQMDQNKLDTEQYFLRKDDFRDFREEYRDDRREINEKLDRLLAKPQ